MTPTVVVERTKAPAAEATKAPEATMAPKHTKESTTTEALPRAENLGKIMKILIVYDTLYGNTEKIAEAIREGVGSEHEVKFIKATEAKFDDIGNIDLLIIGSPTHGGRYTQPTKNFLDSMPDKVLQNINAVTFDTGSSKENQGAFAKFMIGLFGYASPRIAKELNKKGANILGSETFFVLGKEEPLKEGEIERAKEWANGLMKKVLEV